MKLKSAGGEQRRCFRFRIPQAAATVAIKSAEPAAEMASGSQPVQFYVDRDCGCRATHIPHDLPAAATKAEFMVNASATSLRGDKALAGQ